MFLGCCGAVLLFLSYFYDVSDKNPMALVLGVLLLVGVYALYVLVFSHPGYFDQNNQVDLVLPQQKWKTSSDSKFMVIGRPGTDGITFQIAKNAKNFEVYAHYPILNERVKIARNIEELIVKWKQGKIIL